MAKKPHGGGPVPENIRIYCEAQVREVALPKMVAYMKKRDVSAKDWHWCFEQLVKLGKLVSAESEGGSGHEDNLDKLT